MASEVQTAVTQNVTFTTVQSGSDLPSALVLGVWSRMFLELQAHVESVLLIIGRCTKGLLGVARVLPFPLDMQKSLCTGQSFDRQNLLQ